MDVNINDIKDKLIIKGLKVTPQRQLSLFYKVDSELALSIAKG
jgi:hypothetical protein